jgi:hypothetical protein
MNGSIFLRSLRRAIQLTIGGGAQCDYPNATRCFVAGQVKLRVGSALVPNGAATRNLWSSAPCGILRPVGPVVAS